MLPESQALVQIFMPSIQPNPDGKTLTVQAINGILGNQPMPIV
jgi:hypothetical protein